MMKMRSVGAIVAAIACSFLFAGRATGQSIELRVVASNGVKAVLENLRAQEEKAIGRPLAIQFNTAAALKRRIDAGEQFDVAFLASDVIDDLVREGKILAGTRKDLSRTGVGIGIRAGAPKPAIGTAEALKRTLRSAKSITYVQEGASRVSIDKAFERLGIVDEMKLKTTFHPRSGPANAMVAEGKADLILTLISEIVPAPGVALLGPLPADLQNYVSFAAGVNAHSKNVEAAKALINFLAGPAAASAFKAQGMETR
jgi:molybdate transport system substrate-binding protein